jgi:hypothetical protein
MAKLLITFIYMRWNLPWYCVNVCYYYPGYIEVIFHFIYPFDIYNEWTVYATMIVPTHNLMATIFLLNISNILFRL